MIGRQIYGVHYTDATDSAGVSIRYWSPPIDSLPASASLVIYCHQLSGSQQISAGYWSYSIVHAAVQQGCMVVASNAHGDNWGNDASLTDVVNEYNFMNSLHAVGSVVIVGASMGGLDSALTAAKGSLPDLKGVYLIDPVMNLDWAYTATSGGTANAFQSSINAAYGVSSFASIPAGHDPVNSFDASVYAGYRWRFYASTGDTTVAKANNADAFQSKISASAVESGMVTHNTGNHASSSPVRDFSAFLARCLS